MNFQFHGLIDYRKMLQIQNESSATLQGHLRAESVHSEDVDSVKKLNSISILNPNPNSNSKLRLNQKISSSCNSSHEFEVILGCEHPVVVTLGRSADIQQSIYAHAQHETISSSLQLPVHVTDRGGLATLHSPGQLVIYPILPLRKYGMGVRDYVNLLEQTTIELLSNSGIESYVKEDSGVYTKKGKIAFIGIRVEKGVSRHGLSLNVSNDLNLFSKIVSCGVSNRSLDLMQDYCAKQLQLSAVFEQWCHIFALNLSKFRVKKLSSNRTSSLSAVGSAFP